MAVQGHLGCRLFSGSAAASMDEFRKKTPENNFSGAVNVDGLKKTTLFLSETRSPVRIKRK
jgi:hypothetical protein